MCTVYFINLYCTGPLLERALPSSFERAFTAELSTFQLATVAMPPIVTWTADINTWESISPRYEKFPCWFVQVKQEWKADEQVRLVCTGLLAIPLARADGLPRWSRKGSACSSCRGPQQFQSLASSSWAWKGTCLKCWRTVAGVDSA